jgi:hypothetical protein
VFRKYKAQVQSARESASTNRKVFRKLEAQVVLIEISQKLFEIFEKVFGNILENFMNEDDRPVYSDYSGGDNVELSYWKDLRIWCKQKGICTRCRQNKTDKPYFTCKDCRAAISVNSEKNSEKVIKRRTTEQYWLEIGRKLLIERRLKTSPTHEK